METKTIFASIIAMTLTGVAVAAGTDQKPEAGIDPTTSTSMSTGDQAASDTVMASGSYRLRASDVIGMDVQNSQQEEVGEVDDLIITEDDTVVHAVVSVGGFLGIGDKLVTVPYSELQVPADRGNYVVYNATKEELEAKPEFEYKDGELTGREYRNQVRKDTVTQ